MIIAVILIGGSGKRFGSSLPKQFMRVNGKDWHVFKKGLACHNIWKYDTDTPWEAYCDYYKRCQTDNKAKIAIETSQNCSTKT